MINDLQTWVAGRPEGQTVSFAGANDIEPGFGDPIPVPNWVSGFDTNTNWFMYNYGSADGCSSTQVAGAECGTAGHPSWVAEDIYYVSWGAQPAIPAPEIYFKPPPGNPTQAKQWYWLSKYGVAAHGSFFVFRSSFTEFASDASSNTPAQGYIQLYNQINADPATDGPIKSSTDITHAN